MNIENININQVFFYKKRNNLDKIKNFLEKKYHRQIFYTVFKEDSVLFVNTNVRYPKEFFSIDEYIKEGEDIFLSIVKNEYISTSIINFKIPTIKNEMVFSKDKLSSVRLSLIKGVSIIKQNDLFIFDVMTISYKESNINLLEFMNRGESIDTFLKIYKSQLPENSELVGWYFNKDYFLDYYNV